MTNRVLVLGGYGFIGRHAVQALHNQNQPPVIGSRRPPAHHNVINVNLEQCLKPKDWSELLDPFDVVLNCVGILRPQGAATYDKVHHLAPKALAEACKAKDIRFVHVSAMGLAATDRSGFLRSKLAGEHAIKAVGGDWVIVRPSLLDGAGGFGASWLRGVAQLPVFVAPTTATGKFAAVQADEVGEALALLCLQDQRTLSFQTSREFELGGDHNFNFAEYVRHLRKDYSTKAALAIPIPGWLARLGAHVCDALRFSPFSFGHWELLQKDNIPAPNRLAEVLGRAPRPIGKYQ